MDVRSRSEGEMAAGATNRTGDRSSREEAPRKPRSLGLRKAVLALLVATVSGVAFGAQSELLVSAAASLTNAFGAMAPAFEAAHPGAAVTLNFAASGALLRQVDQGAPVDVFASADQETMDRAAGKGLLAPDSRKDFARNRLVLVVPKASVGTPAGLAELGGPAVTRVAAGDPGFVPAGRYARQALAAASLWEALQPKLVLANSVRQVLDYVVRDEVDAGFVYQTDAALRSDRVRVVERLGGHPPILYPIAVVEASRNRPLAQKFVDFVLGREGQAILARFGFETP